MRYWIQCTAQYLKYWFLAFLQGQLDSEMSQSMMKVYVVAIAVCHSTVEGKDLIMLVHAQKKALLPSNIGD